MSSTPKGSEASCHHSSGLPPNEEVEGLSWHVLPRYRPPRGRAVVHEAVRSLSDSRFLEMVVRLWKKN